MYDVCMYVCIKVFVYFFPQIFFVSVVCFPYYLTLDIFSISWIFDTSHFKSHLNFFNWFGCQFFSIVFRDGVLEFRLRRGLNQATDWKCIWKFACVPGVGVVILPFLTAAWHRIGSHQVLQNANFRTWERWICWIQCKDFVYYV